MNAITIDHVDAAIAADGSYKVGNFERGRRDGTVNAQWSFRPDDQRFLSLDTLRDHLRAVHDRSWEAKPDLSDLRLVAVPGVDDLDPAQLAIDVAGKRIQPTHWSFGQIANMASAPPNYLRSLPAEIAVQALTWGLANNRPEEGGIMVYADDATLHAVTTPKYGRIPDYQVIEAVQEVAGTGRGEMRWKVPGMLDWSTMRYHPNVDITKDTTTLYASDRDFFVFLVDDRNPIEVGKLKSGEPDLMFRGFYVRGSSVGAYRQSVSAFLLRGVCQNRNIWGVEGFAEVDIVHREKAPARWMDTVKPALLDFANGNTSRLVAGVAEAKRNMVASDHEGTLEFLNKKLGFPMKTAKAMLANGERDEGEPPRSVWSVAQAITAHARDIPHTDERLAVELKAKKLLDRVKA